MHGASLQKGFTLLEIIVSMSIFALIVLMAISTFQSINEGQRSAIASQNTQESMRYAFEIMSKEMRTAQARNPKCGGTTNNKVFNVNSSQDILYFLNKNNECTQYYIYENSLYIKRNSGGIGLPVTPDEVKVSNLKFSIIDDNIGAFHGIQPMVTMKMDVEMASTSAMHKNKINLQTTVSSRHYE